MPVARRCVKTLRRQERPVDCGDIVRRSGHGLARARAAPREPIGGAGRCGRGGHGPREKTFNGERGPQLKKMCQISLRIIIGMLFYGGT